MALIRLTLVQEYVGGGKISIQPRETLINSRVIESVTTLMDDRISLLIKTVGDPEVRVYAAIDSAGHNSVHEAYAEEVLADFQSFIHSAEERQ